MYMSSIYLRMKSASFDKSLSIEHNDMLLHACIHVHVDVHVYMTTCIILKNLAEGKLHRQSTLGVANVFHIQLLPSLSFLKPSGNYSTTPK